MLYDAKQKWQHMYRIQAHGLCVEQGIVGHSRKWAVRVHHSDALPHKHTTHQWKTVEAGSGCGLVIHDLQGEVVDLQSIGQVPDALPPAVGVGDNYHLVPLFNQTLGKLINVTFHSAHIGIEEIWHHADAVLLGGAPGKVCRSFRAFLRWRFFQSSCSLSLVHFGFSLFICIYSGCKKKVYCQWAGQLLILWYRDH